MTTTARIRAANRYLPPPHGGYRIVSEDFTRPAVPPRAPSGAGGGSPMIRPSTAWCTNPERNIAMAKTKKTVITCDHPDCEEVVIVEQRVDLPGWWIYGTANDTGDGRSINWYACSDSHVGPAVLGAFKEVRNAD